MTQGVVFDIREFTLHDGPGIRTTVFLKGCSLRCSWCHNPEGMSSEPQTIESPAGRRMAGTWYTPATLAGLLNKQANILRDNEGGVTFSGGEPLSQAPFVAETIDLLDDIHVLLDTSGYSSEQDFRLVARGCDRVYFDVKLVDRELHKRYTGVDNDSILRNLQVLSEMKTPFVIRVPLVPGVTDTDQNLADIAGLAKGKASVHLLPYNRVAGAKYKSAGMVFNPNYNEQQSVNINTAIFKDAGVEVHVV
jgi:pyruvate formate lyase activating enzyme